MTMRRVHSAPQLHSLDAAPLTVASAPRFPGSPRHLHVQSGALPKKTLKVLTEKGFLPVTQPGLRMRSCSTNALPLLAPIPPPPPDDGAAAILADVFEQADELLEEFVWAKGLIPAGECFEQFGWTESAPALKDVGNHVTEEQRKGLASCLATPFMYDNEHLSKRAQELVMKRGQVMEQQLTNRFVEEVQSQQEEEEAQNSSSFAGQEAVARSRRRRRPDKMLAYGYLQTLAPSLAGYPKCPETHRRLARALSSVDDNKNKLHLDEQFLADKKNGLATSSLDPASMPMVVADTLLFMAHDSHRTDSMHSNPGSVMVTARDDNSMLVQQDQAAGAQSVKGSSETNLDPAKFEVNEFKADEYLSTDAEQDVDSDADEPAGASADLAEMQTPVENNIVPFLLARIAQVLQ